MENKQGTLHKVCNLLRTCDSLLKKYIFKLVGYFFIVILIKQIIETDYFFSNICNYWIDGYSRELSTLLLIVVALGFDSIINKK